MEFNNASVRRQDRLLTEAEARKLLAYGEYGILSMIRPDGTPYGIPINYVWDGESYIYLHCAPEGEKLRSLACCPDVSFCVVGHTHVMSRQFTTGYESIVLTCRAVVGLPAEERMHALHLLLAKYSPDDQETGKRYAEKSFHRTEIIRLEVKRFSGKCKRVK